MVKTILITRDSKGKIRVAEIWYTWDEQNSLYNIFRVTGLHNGGKIEHHPIVVSKGKASRTTEEQVKLQYNAFIKNYKDKGYKDIKEFGFNSLEEFDPEKVFPKEVVDQDGAIKPMLCKVYDENDSKNQGKTYYISRKLDGVRCSLFYENGEIKTSSRGGQNYDSATTNIRKNHSIKELFANNSDITLDGELYIHGKPLSYISGLCRTETVIPEHRKLEFHCYDIIDTKNIFEDRLSYLLELAGSISEQTPIKFVEHIKLNDLSEIDFYHDKFVTEGYEGAVIRDANEVYKPNGRDRRMQKIKKFSSGEFEILGLVEGLRDEDLCFLMQTKEGCQFKAKPIGDREQKQYYRDNINNIIGKMGTVKYFGFTTTKEPVPNLPVFCAIRDYE